MEAVNIEPAADAAVRRRLADQEGHLRIFDVVAREIFAHVVGRDHIHMVRHLVDVGFFAEIGVIPLDAAAARRIERAGDLAGRVELVDEVAHDDEPVDASSC